MDTLQPELIDVSDHPVRGPQQWEPLLVSKEHLDAEVEHLVDSSPASTGRRAAAICHPRSRGTVPSLTPGTEVTLEVLKPGEFSHARRTNANRVEISIRGSGTVRAGEMLHPQLHDAWTIPPMTVFSHHNDGDDIWVRLSYSNAPLLEKLGVLFEENAEHGIAGGEIRERLDDHVLQRYNVQNAPDMPILDKGARLRGYEFLTDIEVVESRALLWPWQEVQPHLSQKPGDNGRGIWLLYNPATEKRQGTSASYFVTFGGCPPGTPPFTGTRGHRHISASLNYHTRGYGASVVNGERVEWKAGDLLYSAPGWSEHAHYPGPEGWTVITVQDHPMHIALNSLLWQEDMAGPIYALGSQSGQKGYVGPRAVGE